MILHLARLDTPSYRFEALGSTEREAVAALERTWEQHAEQTDAFLTWAELSDDVNVTALEVGAGYRDGSQVVEPETPAAEPGAWNTSPPERWDLAAVLVGHDLEALAAGHVVHLEGYAYDDPHGMPGAIVRLSFDPHA